ncbi:DUF397 domain-containing protein [Streptomyces sp. NBC_01601]|uniref:DUF397 domain-containing protein n=1 Tax=Streptomyces sp. NBC_01601 TaxID=2975892 RepID=UPI002E288F6C|nr:DUF397 domain-containing protein [Streptomyces sp. NBC_01601]
MTQELAWWKSSYSGQNGGDCIECAVPSPSGATCTTQDVVFVRDSKRKEGPHLTISIAGWNSFVAAATRGALGAV